MAVNKNYTQNEELALRDCLWCKLAKWTDDGEFEKCQSEGNPSGRPLLECRYQQPDYKS